MATDTPTSAQDTSGRAYLMLTITTLCWGANAIFGRLAVGEVSPMVLVMFRWAGVVLLIGLFARTTIHRNWPLLRRHLLFMAALGTLGFTGFNALFYVAAHSTTAVNIGIIQGAIPVFVLIGMFIIHRIRVTLLQAIGVTLTLLGVVIVGTGGHLDRLGSLTVNPGDLMMLLAGLCYAIYAIGLRHRPAVPALAMFAVMAATAFVTSLPLVAIEGVLGHLQWPTPTGWLIISAVIVLPSFLAQIFFINSVEIIGPGRAGVFINLVPVFASIFAVTFLSEPFHLFHAVALALVLGGIGLSEKGKVAG